EPTGTLRFSQPNQHYEAEGIIDENQMAILRFDIKTPIYVPMSVFNTLSDCERGRDSRCRISQHVHEQFTVRMVDAALGWAEQAKASSGKCHANDEESVDEDPLPPTPISSLLPLPSKPLPSLPLLLPSTDIPSLYADPVKVDDDIVPVTVQQTSKHSIPSPPSVLIEDPPKFELAGLLTVPESVSTNTDSSQTTEPSTPSPKSPSTCGPLSYLPSSPLPSPPSSPPPALAPALSTPLGLGLHLGFPPQQPQIAPPPPPPQKASLDLSPGMKNYPRKCRPDSTEYLHSPPIELLESIRHKFTTDKISELPNHFVPGPLPFTDEFPDDIVSAPKRQSSQQKANDPSKGWLDIHLYDDPDSSDFERDTWRIILNTHNSPKASVWDRGYNFWEENGRVTLLAKNRNIPWHCLAPYHTEGKPDVL
ncbi:hypothetical protein H0H93_013953, partial [Arthromyces matolae]